MFENKKFKLHKKMLSRYCLIILNRKKYLIEILFFNLKITFLFAETTRVINVTIVIIQNHLFSKTSLICARLYYIIILICATCPIHIWSNSHVILYIQ